MDSSICFVSSNLLEDPGFTTYFSGLLKTKTFTDVTFVLETQNGETEIFAHQLILAMRSSYFADKFYGNERNKENQIIHLRKVNPQAFKDMIRYCYGSKLALKAIEEAFSLLKVANEFKVMSLMNLCCTHLRAIKIEHENVFSMLKVSEYMKDKSLTDVCYKLLEEKTREVMASYELQDITPVMVHIILDLKKLSLSSEYELIKWLFDWAKVKFEEDSSCETTREYMEKLLQDMNFLDLKLEEFALLCKDYPDFFSSDEIASIYLNIMFPGLREMPDWFDKDLRCRVFTGSKKSEMQVSEISAGEEYSDLLAGHIKESLSNGDKIMEDNFLRYEENFRRNEENFRQSVENFHRIEERFHRRNESLCQRDVKSFQLVQCVRVLGINMFERLEDEDGIYLGSRNR